jgi:salicylate hydroxylase
MSRRIERIAIVGAGMAGLALALALRRRGLSPEVVERRDGWSEHGAGIYLVGNAVRAWPRSVCPTRLRAVVQRSGRSAS